MYWWLKDVLVERTVHHEQQQSHSRRVQHPVIRKLWFNFKNIARSSIKQHRKKHKVRQSYEALSKLNDHYLTDIGLRKIDLDSISKGYYPGQYQQSAAPNPYRRALKVVTDTKNDFVPKQNYDGDYDQYEKAA